jgi:hypothetical protein
MESGMVDECNGSAEIDVHERCRAYIFWAGLAHFSRMGSTANAVVS